MRKFRHKALDYFLARPMPTWGADLSEIDFNDLTYYVRPLENQAKEWEDLPDDIKATWDKLGIPAAERKYLAGVGAMYDSEVVFHRIQESLEAQGVIFMDTDSALKEHEEIFRKYFATVIPPNDNKLASLNSAVWSGGSFVYIPPGVKVEMPLQAYFRINSPRMSQAERTCTTSRVVFLPAHRFPSETDGRTSSLCSPARWSSAMTARSIESAL